jgi:hypothetical protein
VYRDRDGSLNINLETLLSQYVTSLDGYLGKILDHIQNLIGIAHRNEDLGMNIYGVLKQVEEDLERQIPWMDSILPELTLNWKSKKLLRDWRLTQAAVRAISDLSGDLAIAKVEFVRWKTNVREFAVCPVDLGHANISRPVLEATTWAILDHRLHRTLRA